MSGVELQEYQGKTIEQNIVTDEVRLDNKLKELGNLEKQIFSGDGIIAWESDDTSIDTSYKKGIEQAKTIQQKIDFIESLVFEFQNERKLQELFQKKQELPYSSKDTDDKLHEWKNKIQQLFQKYPDFKQSITKFVEEKFHYTDYFLSYYEETEFSSQEEKEKIMMQVLNGMLESTFYWIWDIEKAIKYVQSNTSIDDKNQFLIDLLMWTPEALYNLWEKMDAISQLSFYHKKEWYKYAPRLSSTAEDIHLFSLLKLDTNKLQKLDSYIKNGDDKGFMNSINDLFSTQERSNLLWYPEIKNKYIEVQRWDLNLPKDTVSDDIIISLSQLKDKSVITQFQKLITDFFNEPNRDIKNSILSQFIHIELWNIVKNSRYLSDNYKIIQIVNDLVTDGASSLWEWTPEYKKMEQLYNTVNDKITQIKTYNQKKVSDYITEQIWYLRSEKDMQSVDVLQKISKIDKKEKSYSEDRAWFISDCDSTDPILSKLILLEDASAKKASWEVMKIPNPAQSPEGVKNTAKIPEMQKSLSRLWLNVKVWENGNVIWANWETQFTQKVWNRTFEVKDDGNIFIQWAFWYNFRYENNLNGIEQYLEIADQIQYLDDMWLWHFWENFKEMVSVLNLYTSYTGLRYINIDDTKMNSTNFINQVELTNISKAFYKIWFLSSENFSYGFKNGEMQKTEFTHIMQTRFEGRNFLKWGNFDREIFKQIITEIDWKNKV